MWSRSHPKARFRAPSFSLAELLVTVAIISILAALLLPALQKGRVAALKSKGAGNLRQTGVGILAYAGDHDGYFPGPCSFGTLPFYNWNAVPMGVLAGFIGPYLGSPDLLAARNYSSYMTVSSLVSPGLVAWNISTLQTNSLVPHYIQNNTLTNAGSAFRILGSVTTPWVQQPLKVMQLSTFGDVSQVWILSDVDQQLNNPTVSASGWYGSLPPRPVYRDIRLRLYADGHVEAISINAP
ncbi:MAG: hypothetical protein B9S32_09895 [Verrucomicrobia bacterium Tous-C9LFEB]|nr:MAG: hypothetical protein B9S32_09895 [Verrucomicrobia bacterium Tous-C9LFEB]